MKSAREALQRQKVFLCPPELDETLAHDPEEAKLIATDDAKKEIAHTVNTLVRTNSLKNGPPSKKGSMELDDIDEEKWFD